MDRQLRAYKGNKNQFWWKAAACIAGIMILFLIASTYRNYTIKEGKAPYLTVIEMIPVLEAFSAEYDTDIYETVIDDTDQAASEYVTVKTVKRVLNDFPQVDGSVLEDYKNDSWYIGVSDWNQILSEIVAYYGNDNLFMTELILLGDKTNIMDVEGVPVTDDQILTDRGIMESVYWNTDAYLYSKVSTVCYQNEILSIIEYSEQPGELRNVYLADVSEEEIHFFADNYHLKYYPVEKNIEDRQWNVEEKNKKELSAGTIVDLEFDKGNILADAKETEFVHGKLLQVSDAGIEIEGYGIFEPSENMEIYRLYSELASMGKKDLRIGYSFTDFVLEDGKVAACLMIKEEDMEYIRVLLKNTDYAGRYHEEFKAYCNQDYEVIYYEDGIETRREEKEAEEYFIIGAEELKPEVERIKLVPKVLSARTTIESIGRSQGTPSYMGTIEITAAEEGLLLVNEVLLEDYLCKVVPSEMPSSYPKEALMAQAVCARTYAYGKMKQTGLPDLGAHVDDSAGFQVYNNIKEQAATTEAVKATHNMVAEYNGEPIGAYYYSTSAGAGTDTAIWHGGGENPPYLQADIIAEDLTGDGQSSENEDGSAFIVTAEDLSEEEIFRQWIQTSDDSHFEAGEGWYRWTYTVEELNSEYLLSVLQKRYESNPNLILTQRADGSFESSPIAILGKIEDIEVVKRLPGGVADELLITGSEAVIKVISELNIRYVLSDGKTKVLRQSGDEVNASSSIPSAYMIIDMVKEEGKVKGYKITGGGFGHGVGMSQNGAKNMAQRGMTCEEILAFFYPGMEIKTLQFGE